MRKSELNKVKVITFCVATASHMCNKYSDDNRSNLTVKQENLSVFQLYYELTFCSIFYIVSKLHEGREYSEHSDLLSFSVFFFFFARTKGFNGVKTPGNITERVTKEDSKDIIKHKQSMLYFFIYCVTKTLILLANYNCNNK